MKRNLRKNFAMDRIYKPKLNDSPFIRNRKLLYYYNALNKSGLINESNVIKSVFTSLPEKFKGKFINEINSFIICRNSKSDKTSGKTDNNIMEPFENFEDYIYQADNDAYGFLKNFILKRILYYLERNIKKDYSGTKCPILKRITDIKNAFMLNDAETEMLTLKYFYENFDDFSRFISCFIDYNDHNLKHLLVMSELAGNFKSWQIKKSLTLNGSIMKYNIIDRYGELSCEISDYINGLSSNTIEEKYFMEYKGSIIKKEHFYFNEESMNMIEELMEKKAEGTKILFYGNPGTGKTEFARSLGISHGLKVYELKEFISNDNDDYNRSKKSFNKLRGLYCFENSIANDASSVIIVDEADALLNTAYASLFGAHSDDGDKAKINNLLDSTKSLQIWITNKYSGIDESTLRRFDYSLKFNTLTLRQRINIWNNLISKHRLKKYLSENDASFFAEKFTVNAAIIEKSIMNCRKILKEAMSRKKIIRVIENTINSFLNLKNTGHNFQNKSSDAVNYSIEGLNIKGNIEKNLEILESFTNSSDTGFKGIKNMNVMLWGPPGTGKTEFAKYVSRCLKKELIVKQASDILSMWVGGTEKNIREAFDEAESSNAILLIDEIDSLLGTREKAFRNWEVTQVNELLSCMEKFKGIFIAATNFMQNVDQAAIRRFNIKLEFDYLTPEGNLVFYKRYFKVMPSKRLTLKQREAVMNIKNLSCGDFKIVYQKYCFINKEEITHESLISGLTEEASIKRSFIKKKVGF